MGIKKTELREIVKRLKEKEGLRLDPYYDIMGYPTIGYGHRIFGNHLIDKEVAEIMLGSDIMKAVHVLELFKDAEKIECPLEVDEVLVEMIFVLGYNGFKKFKKFIKALKENNYKEAALELIDSKWYKEEKQRVSELVEKLIRAGNDYIPEIEKNST